VAKTDAERLKLMPNVALADIKQHYQKTHHAQNMRFVVAGNLKGRQADIESKFASISLPGPGERFELPDEQPRAVDQPVYIPNDTVENLYFYIDTFMRRRMSDPETDALGLVNTLLVETLYSKILGTARERGLVYGMSSGISQTASASNWWFGAQVSEKNAPALFEIIVKEISNMQNGKVKAAEIQAAKQYALGRFQRSAQTVSGTAAGYAGRYFFDEIIDDYYRIPDRIRAVQKETMVDISRSMFAENINCFGALGSCKGPLVESLKSQLQPLWQPNQKAG
jgi:predicted Zn-dependent peptidase